MSDDEKKSRFSLLKDAVLDAAAAKVAGHEKRLASKIFKDNRLDELAAKRHETGMPNWSILRYQHVISPRETPLPLHPYTYVTPNTFEMHMQYLAECCNPIPLAQLVKSIFLGEELPPRTVAITIDNAHADGFLNAFPLLLQYNVPATFCLPTGYVESHSYLPIDRLTIALLSLKKLDIPLPKFECFTEEDWSLFMSSSKNLKLTDALILRVLDVFNKLPEVEKANMMAAIGEQLGEVVELPLYEDFIRWEDVDTMKERGVTFATMGHAFLVSTQVPKDIFHGDVLTSVTCFNKRKIPMEKYFAFVDGVFNKERILQLKEIGFRFALSIGDIPTPNEDEREEFVLLGRTPMFEQFSNTLPLFACRMLRIEEEGVQF